MLKKISTCLIKRFFRNIEQYEITSEELIKKQLEGAIIILSCIIFSLFASSPPVVDASAAAVTQVWKYIGELIFNMLVLVGTIKMSDRVVREMMGL